MAQDDAIAEHYTHGALLAAIHDGLARLGKTPETVTIEDLAPIDEFHIGGRQASGDFLAQLPLDDAAHVLDVGCGLGGASRYTAARFGSRVTGVDLTAEYIETGRTLSNWVGLSGQITLRQASALDIPFQDNHFDAAYMMHVGMNIPLKAELCAEIARVLKPGGVFGIYDVMRTGDGDLTFPMPWAESAETSAVAEPEAYISALEAAGLTISATRNRRDFALEFFEKLRAAMSTSQGPPPLGLHVLMGETRAEKIKNMVGDIAAGKIAPVEMLATKPA